MTILIINDSKTLRSTWLSCHNTYATPTVILEPSTQCKVLEAQDHDRSYHFQHGPAKFSEDPPLHCERMETMIKSMIMIESTGSPGVKLCSRLPPNIGKA